MVLGSWSLVLLKNYVEGLLGGSVGSASNSDSGHDLTGREFEPQVGLCADSSEAGASFGFCLPLSLPLPCSRSVSLSFKNKETLKKKKSKLHSVTNGTHPLGNNRYPPSLSQ